MRQQSISQIFFEEEYLVPHDQTATKLFARLPEGSAYAAALIECFATSYLIAVLESVCIREMRLHVDWVAEVIVGRNVGIDHHRPIPPGTRLRLCGWIQGMGDRSATFRVNAHDDIEVVCDAAITLVTVQRASMALLIATKKDRLRLGRLDEGDDGTLNLIRSHSKSD